MRTSRRSARGLAALALAASLATPAVAQDEGDFPIGPPVPFPGQEPEGAVDEMEVLFAEVERKLREIDVLLSDAGAGDTRLLPTEDSGLADLLRASRQGSEQVVQGIDEILELARERANQQQPSGGGGEPQEQQPGDEPPPQQGDGQQSPGDRENTPDAEQMGDPPSQPDQASQGDQDPNSPRDGDQDPHQRPNVGAPPDSELGDPAAPSGDDEWGLLPPRAREVFRSRGADDLPARYRDWIESYYKRLSRVDR